MAEAAAPNLSTEQELTCSICLDLFTDPVSTPCGHNFCQACIGGYWASTATCTCPLCKHSFEERPQLSINKVFAMITENYKISRYGAAAITSSVPSSNSNPFVTASNEDVVWCDVCTGIKQPAVSSCLMCTAAYCSEHVKPHQNTPFYAKHPLMDPQQALKGRTCELHRRLLEVFCRTCQRCICAICVLEDHRTHQTVSVQTERLSKQKHVARTEQEILNRIKDKEMNLAELKTKMDGVKTYGERERGEVETLLDEAAASLDRLRAQVVGGVQQQMGAVLARGEGQVSHLEAELGQLTDRRARLEAQAVRQDHIGFLQSFSEATAPLGSDVPINVDDLDLNLHFNLGGVKAALAEIRDKMETTRLGGGGGGARGSVASLSSVDPMMAAESMLNLRGSSSSLRRSQWALRDLKKMKPVSGHKKARVYMEDVTLNPMTAYPFLILSEDRKQVKRGEKLQFYRNSQHRFDVWSCVSAKDGYVTGRHYWEVLVGESKDWKLGVASESAQRKGLFDMSPSNGYFAVWWSGSQLRALTTPPLTKVKTPPKLRHVGMFLDVEAGQMSFYNAKSGSELFSFNCGEFTEQMFPLFGTGDKEVPLVILT
ncbi:bloodthirsty-related gene family, member 30 [Festucalex cinctus]